MLHPTSRDLYLRHTTPDGKSYVIEHRVWDADLFLAAQQQAARRVNEQQPPGAKRLARVDMVDRATYQAERRTRDVVPA